MLHRHLEVEVEACFALCQLRIARLELLPSSGNG